MAAVIDSELPVDEDNADGEDIAPEPAADDAAGGSPPVPKNPKSAPRRAMLLGLAVVVALGALGGWFGFRAHQSHQAQAERSQLVQAARQGALNLTTIDWQRADADVQRILDSATGQFYDDFAKRSRPFIELVKQTKSTTVGTVTEAGLESQPGGTAQVLVAVTVMTSNVGAPQPDPHSWRMRISVQRVGNQAKVSNVEFVP
jgi:Mce-associated membrane protein